MKSDVYNTDCLEMMRGLPDKAFDLAIVDPPYGIGQDGRKGSIATKAMHSWRSWERKEWDTSSPESDYFIELTRISINQIIWGANYFTPNLPPSKGWIFWDKGQDLTMSDGELAFTSFNVPLRRRVFNRCVAREEGLIHPTQKPVALYKWLLQNYAKQGDTILDTHLGSGSSRIAAYDLGFDFTATELDKDYFDAQEKRFADHIAQPKLWEPTPSPIIQEPMFV